MERRKNLTVIFAMLALVFLSGCSASQYRKEFVGMFPSDVTGDKKKIVKVINMASSACFDKTATALKDMGASLLKEDRENNFIVADQFERKFISTVDTTEVGVVFASEAPDRTRLEVASDSPGLAFFVSEKLFAELEKIK